MFYYTLLQLALWWLMHVSVMFWMMQFPFHARQVKKDHHLKHIHITCVIVGLLVPLIPIIVTIAQDATSGNNDIGTIGFGLTRFPPILCNGINRNAVYYSFVLPSNLILIGGMTLLPAIFWIIHKVSLHI